MLLVELHVIFWMCKIWSSMLRSWEQLRNFLSASTAVIGILWSTFDVGNYRSFLWMQLPVAHFTHMHNAAQSWPLPCLIIFTFMASSSDDLHESPMGVSLASTPAHAITVLPWDLAYVQYVCSKSALRGFVQTLSLIHIWRCRRSTLCRSRWSPYH